MMTTTTACTAHHPRTATTQQTFDTKLKICGKLRHARMIGNNQLGQFENLRHPAACPDGRYQANTKPAASCDMLARPLLRIAGA